MADAKWLQGTTDLWLVRSHEQTLSAGRWSDGTLRDDIAIGTAPGGWDATVASDGTPWIVWSDGALVYARRAADGRWGPVLQVSTVGPDAHPAIIPDTYGNVWIVWWRSLTMEVWLCRMGPRSGQAILVASNAEAPPLAVEITGGTLRVVLADGRIAEGTEHGGFGSPIAAG